MASSVVSLNAATAVGPGAPLTFSTPTLINGAIQVFSTGSPSFVNVEVEITLDGTNWVPDTQISSLPRYFQFQRVAFGVRANLIGLSGGTSPAVTAIIAAA
jgi:hypothetical protein